MYNKIHFSVSFNSKNILIIKPQSVDMSLQSLQQKLKITTDGIFGPDTLHASMLYFNLTPERASHFFAQVSHETANFKYFVENLNYSTKGLNSIFPKYFKRVGRNPTRYHRNPEKIANLVYANRMGNGNEESGDGWKYRGRGAIQLTGKNNYELFSKYINNPEVLTNPDIVATLYPFESAIFFFDTNKLWDICDKGVTDGVILSLTKRINGGTNGLSDRINKTHKYYEYIK